MIKSGEKTTTKGMVVLMDIRQEPAIKKINDRLHIKCARVNNRVRFFMVVKEGQYIISRAKAEAILAEDAQMKKKFQEAKSKLYLYDVCSDFSLCPDVSDARRKEAESNKYRWVERKYLGSKILLGYHKHFDELHFAKSEFNCLKGRYVF